uniref:Uncharacterized protein n=1 Tax=Anguilla anguilla TaxID=7936 RepID=A0A0E9UTY4_ANGAN
MYNTWQSI